MSNPLLPELNKMVRCCLMEVTMGKKETDQSNREHDSLARKTGVNLTTQTTESTAMRFRGKVAAWWYGSVVFLIASTVALAATGIYGVASSASDAGVSIVGALVFVLFDFFVIDSCIRNYVDFREDSLKVRVSVFSETISYASISLVKETNSAWASLSTSLDRLSIKYDNYNEILIAVKDKEGFLTEIAKRNPHIRVERKSK